MSPKKSANSTVTLPKKRSYDSSRRKRQAEQTRSEVLVAAMQLFNTRGWAETTLADIAEAAGVAVETIYKGFRSKKQLVRDAMDAAVVGDADPVPFVERDPFLGLGEGTRTERLRAGMDILADTHARSAGVWRACGEAAAGDDELETWMREGDQRRRIDIVRSLERIFEHPIIGPMVDAIWVLYGPEAYWQLVHVMGHSRAEYQAVLAEATLRLLGEPVDESKPRRSRR
jgi:AcrR family transcriptional regulator